MPTKCKVNIKTFQMGEYVLASLDMNNFKYIIMQDLCQLSNLKRS